MRRTLLAMLALTLIYCSDATGPLGPVGFAVVSGDDQVVQAGRDSLIEPVVGQAYRDADGNVAFRMSAAPLHAQTPIGTGVPNILTCAEPVGDVGLEPWLACRETDSQGFVTYWFDGGNVATDNACAEIRATVNSERTILATVCAVVGPGPIATFHFQHSGSGVPTRVQPGDTIDARLWVRSAVDEYGNAIPLDTVYAIPDSRVVVHWVDRSVDTRVDVAVDTGWVAVVPPADTFTMPRDSTRYVGAYMTIQGVEETSGNTATMEIKH